jgi:hypothetical protein
VDILFKRKKDLELANNESKLKKAFRGNPRRASLFGRALMSWLMWGIWL